MQALAVALILVTGGQFEEGEGDTYGAAADEACQCGEAGCDSCGHGYRRGGKFGNRGQGRRRQMPQTCYNPSYGCYPGNNRHIHRYPAFHGVYYRRPYNYRNLFDYPWHAELHEPTSLFSYRVPAEQQNGAGDDLSPPESLDDLPPTPDLDDSVSRRRTVPQARLRPIEDSFPARGTMR